MMLNLTCLAYYYNYLLSILPRRTLETTTQLSKQSHMDRVLTSLTVNSSVSSRTVTNISVNPVSTRCSVKTRITGTFIDLCVK